MPKVLTTRGGNAPFEFSGTTEEILGEDFSEEGFEDEVRVFGGVEDVERSFVVRGRIECEKSFTCDRCLTQATKKQIHEFEEEFDKSEAVEDLIDITELLRDVLIADQPMKNLCKADCKGLCPKCGANLNDGECSCDKSVLNPRFAALEDFKIEEV